MELEKIIGIVSGLLTSASMLPQFAKLVKTKDSENISMGMLLVLLTGVAGWIYYGFLKNDWIIIATNVFAFIVNLVTMILSIRYKKTWTQDWLSDAEKNFLNVRLYSFVAIWIRPFVGRWAIFPQAHKPQRTQRIKANFRRESFPYNVTKIAIILLALLVGGCFYGCLTGLSPIAFVICPRSVQFSNCTEPHPNTLFHRQQKFPHQVQYLFLP